MNDFFNLPDDVVSTANQSKTYEKKTDENLYDPNPDISGGSYKSVFRFIPNLKNKSESKYTKYSAKIWNPIAKKSIIVDCPSNENKPSVLWTLSSILGKLYKEEPTIVKEINENYSRWYTHHSYIYITKDPQVDSLQGKIKLFKYRAQVNDLIEHQISPEEESLLGNVSSVNPFHLLEGKDFLCVVTKKNKQWRDWTKCKFIDEVTPFRFKVGENEVTMKNEEGAIKLVTEFFNKNAPSLEDYRHQPWTDETYVQVAEALKAAIPYEQVFNMLIEETRDEKMKALLLGGSTSSHSLSSTSSESSNTNDFFSGESKPAESKITPKESTTESSSSLETDEYDDIFKNL